MQGIQTSDSAVIEKFVNENSSKKLNLTFTKSRAYFRSRVCNWRKSSVLQWIVDRRGRVYTLELLLLSWLVSLIPIFKRVSTRKFEIIKDNIFHQYSDYTKLGEKRYEGLLFSRKINYNPFKLFTNKRRDYSWSVISK